jgi:hypothetical protein
MNTEIIQKLLKKIHHYYPIGFSHIYNEYDGAKELYQLVGEKIDKVVNEQNQDWLMFLEDIQKETEKIIFNESYLQFPNYVFHIKLLEEFPAVTQKHELVRTNKNIVPVFLCWFLIILFISKLITGLKDNALLIILQN